MWQKLVKNYTFQDFNSLRSLNCSGYFFPWNYQCNNFKKISLNFPKLQHFFWISIHCAPCSYCCCWPPCGLRGHIRDRVKPSSKKGWLINKLCAASDILLRSFSEEHLLLFGRESNLKNISHMAGTDHYTEDNELTYFWSNYECTSPILKYFCTAIWRCQLQISAKYISKWDFLHHITYTCTLIIWPEMSQFIIFRIVTSSRHMWLTDYTVYSNRFILPFLLEFSEQRACKVSWELGKKNCNMRRQSKTWVVFSSFLISLLLWR